MRKHCFTFFILPIILAVQVYAQSGVRYTPIAIPMRDGKFLAADLYSIDTTMAKPVILIQTPYNKNRYRDRVGVPEAGGSPFPYDSVNYTYVVVDWRGRFGSKDAEVPGYDLGLDGYDCVEWIVRQRWCNGKVGLWGSSALGQIQFLTAKHQPPHLVCAVPLVRDYKTNYEDYFYGGVYRKEHVESLALLGFVSTQLILSHPSEDLFWQILEMNSDYPESINVPMLLIGGWYDHFPDEVMRAFDELRTRSDPAVRQKHKLMIGPWLHMELGKLQQGGLEYPNAVSVHDSAAMQFFDYYLRGIQNGYEQQPVVRYYQMGSNGWQSTGDWNSLSTSIDTLYLHPGGLLLSAVPSQSAALDSILYDPRNPSPTVGGSRFNPFDTTIALGAQDQRQLVESRSDVLIYTTPVLENNMVIDGAIKVLLYVSSDRKDTDFSIRLCDVYPDGRSMLLTQGIRRMRFRDSDSTEKLMTPGQIYPVTIELQNIAITFLKGHRLQIDVSSSDYPMFDINLNNGGAIYIPGDTLIATNYIYHDAIHPSWILLPSLTTTSAKEDFPSVLHDYRLEQNYPNPFNPTTTIRFSVLQREHVTLKVFDLLGRVVATLVDKELSAGEHFVVYSAKGVPSGVYFYQLISGKYIQTKKMLITN